MRTLGSEVRRPGASEAHRPGASEALRPSANVPPHVGIEGGLQAHAGCLGKAKEDSLTPTRDELMARCWPHDLATKAISQDEADPVWDQFAREGRLYREVKTVAEIAVFWPFLVGTKVFDRRLYFNNPHLACIREGKQVGTSTIGECDFWQGAKPMIGEATPSSPSNF